MQKIHSVAEDGRLVTATPPAEELAALRASQFGELDGQMRTVGEMLDRGEAVFRAGRWIFGDPLRTLEGMVSPAHLSFECGVDRAKHPMSIDELDAGRARDADAHWFEVRNSAGVLVKRAVAVDAKGILRKMTGVAGAVG